MKTSLVAVAWGCTVTITISCLIGTGSAQTTPSGTQAREDSIAALEAELAALRAEYDTRLRELESRIEALRTEALGEPEPEPEPESEEPVDEELLAEAAAALGLEPGEVQQAPAPTPTPAPEPSPPSVSTGGTGGAAGQTLNPNISVIGDFLGTASDGGPPTTEGQSLDLREVEIAFQSAIDPFARADFFITVPSLERVEIEEGTITFLSLPSSFLARAGKIRVPFGRVNVDHRPESFAVERPDVITSYFGDEGLAEMGVTVSRLIPNPWDRFMELELDVLTGANETSFGGGTAKDLLYNLHYRSFFDLTLSQSLNLGLSYANGVNGVRERDESRLRTQFEGLDVTYQWKPLARGSYRSFLWQTELMLSQRDGLAGTEDSWGMYSFARYQLSRRWFAGGRFDLSPTPTLRRPDLQKRAYSVLAEFFPSEFQRFRVQYKLSDWEGDEPTSHELFFQWFYLIGSHGAHKF